jgi:hypothetical protein
MTNRKRISPFAQRAQSPRKPRDRGPRKGKAVSAKPRTRYESFEEFPSEFSAGKPAKIPPHDGLKLNRCTRPKSVAKSTADQDGTSEEELPPTFDFSEVEWAEIESAVAAVRKEPLTKEERNSLCYSADEFIANSNARMTGTYPSPRKRADLWRTAAKLCAQFRKAIEVASKNRYGDGWKHETIGPAHYLGEVVDLLDMLEWELNEHTDPSYWEVSIEHSVTGRLDPSVVFYQRILWHWTYLGGSLTLTKDPISRKISGPLLKYFFAVVRPVMGDRAPSSQSLPDVVNRQKLFQQKLNKEGNEEV